MKYLTCDDSSSLELHAESSAVLARDVREGLDYGPRASAPKWVAVYSSDRPSVPQRRTTILAYVIAVLGFVMICGGIYSFFDLWNARAPLRHYAITIGMICGGFAMGGIAQALRLLLVIVYAIHPPQ